MPSPRILIVEDEDIIAMARRDAKLLRTVEARAAEEFALMTVPSANEAKRMVSN